MPGFDWITAAAGVFSSLGASGAAKKQAKLDFKNKKELNEQEGMIGRKNAQFERSLDYYYKQLDKQERMRGLDEFRKFSTVKNFAPNYVNTNTGPVVPTAPSYNSGEYATTSSSTPPNVDMNKMLTLSASL